MPYLVVTGKRGEKRDGNTRCSDLRTPPVRLTYFCSESVWPSISIADVLTRCNKESLLVAIDAECFFGPSPRRDSMCFFGCICHVEMAEHLVLATSKLTLLSLKARKLLLPCSRKSEI